MVQAGNTAVDWREALRAARAQHKSGGGTVLDVLLRTAHHQEAALIEWLRAQAGVQVFGSGSPPLAPDFEAWPLEISRKTRSVILRDQQGAVFSACEDPWDIGLQQRLNRACASQTQPLAARSADLDLWLGAEAKDQAQLAAGNGNGPMSADGPIVQFVDQALRAGFKRGASDVHFECDRESVSVKHRLDGVMVGFARMSGAQAAQEVISRIKVLALLDITERRLPQDGRFRFALGEGQTEAIDLRVSIMPSVHGEDAVLRLLDKAQLRGRDTGVTLAHLGFSDEATLTLRDLAEMPSGMLLVTGPTGSGKTTTVYAMLSEINTGQEKIITIEDPVEYELPGVLQIPVNERKGLTFAKGLRSILRHDPDRILIGEIRDAETAEIAVQSALTGHLVFTTVHANSVSDIVGRFRHFGLDMFGFMSSLNGVVVQRLLRRLCPHCLEFRQATGIELHWLKRLGTESLTELPHGRGCEHCNGTGYKGRFVIAELHCVDDELRDLITGGAPLSVVKAHAVKQGVQSLAEQSIGHIVRGTTSVDEVRRVVGAA
ncbi:MAG: type II/IV secretion system protein [Paucibacter sp.]|nr:type II/IV secretion system protein [Roseateles sp.]